MKKLMILAVLGFSFSGLVACSSAKKEKDDVMADVAEIEQTDETSLEDNFQPMEEPAEDPSLGIGSSGLGH